jgi:hypothetical protein
MLIGFLTRNPNVASEHRRDGRNGESADSAASATGSNSCTASGAETPPVVIYQRLAQAERDWCSVAGIDRP